MRGEDDGWRRTYSTDNPFGGMNMVFSVAIAAVLVVLIAHACNPFVPGAHPQGLTPCVANDSGPRVRDSSGACVRRAP